MAEPFVKQELYQERLSNLKELDFELEEEEVSVVASKPKQNNSSNKGYKTPDLLTQMESISQGKPSEEIFQPKPKKKKRKKKKKKPQQQQNIQTNIEGENKEKKKEKQNTDNVVPNVKLKNKGNVSDKPKVQEQSFKDELKPQKEQENKEKQPTVANNNRTTGTDSKQHNVGKDSKEKNKHPHNQRRGFVRNKEDEEKLKKEAEQQKIKKEEKQAVAQATETTKKGKNKFIEIYNQTIFHPVAMKRARDMIAGMGIPVKALSQESALPFALLLNKPKESYSDFFGFTITWMVTGYSNDGRSERLYLELIKAPALIGDDEERNCDMAKVLSQIRASTRERVPDFEFSILISRDPSKEKAEGPVKIYPVKKPFSIDGIISGTFIINEKRTIITGDTAPLNIVRENIDIYQKIINKECGDTPDDIKRFFRKFTRPLSDRERKLLYMELEYFARKAPMDEQIEVLGIINDIRE